MRISIVSRLHVVFDMTICDCKAASVAGLVFFGAIISRISAPGPRVLADNVENRC
jgi:hypothetical protein